MWRQREGGPGKRKGHLKEASEALDAITPQRIFEAGNKIREREGSLTLQKLEKELDATRTLGHRISSGMRAYERHRQAFFAAKEGRPFPTTTTEAAAASAPTGLTETQKRSFANLSGRIVALREKISKITDGAKARGMDNQLSALLREYDTLSGFAQVTGDLVNTPGEKVNLKSNLSLLLLKVEEAELAYIELKNMIEGY